MKKRKNAIFFDMPARDDVAVRAAMALDAELKQKEPFRRIDDFIRRLERLEKRLAILESKIGHEVWF